MKTLAILFFSLLVAGGAVGCTVNNSDSVDTGGGSAEITNVTIAGNDAPVSSNDVNDGSVNAQGESNANGSGTQTGSTSDTDNSTEGGE